MNGLATVPEEQGNEPHRSQTLSNIFSKCSECASGAPVAFAFCHVPCGSLHVGYKFIILSTFVEMKSMH